MNLNHTTIKRALLASTVLLVPAEAFAQEAQDDVEEITVQGVYIPDEKRATSEISNILDSEAFALSGDGNVASAVQRLPGLSRTREGIVLVRGLPDRYNSTLLNGSAIPSTDPIKRIVPLTIFPSSLISSVLVQKTFSPEYPADFGGGVIDIRTKAVPDDFVLEVGISGNYNTEATGKTGLSYDGTSSEIFGFAGSRRNIPTEILQDVTLESLNAQQLEAAGEAIPNIWSIDSEPLYPGAGLNVVVGNRYEVGDGAFGFFAAVNYSVNQRNRVGVRRTVTIDNSGPVKRSDLSPEVCDRPEFEGEDVQDCGMRQSNLDVQLNGILSVGYEFNNDHSLNFTTTVLRDSTKRSLIEKGLFSGEEDLRTRSFIDFIESQVWSNQLSGEHYFNLFGNSETFQTTELKWRANISRSDRDVPQRRETVYEYNPNRDADLILPRPDSNNTTWNALDIETKEFGFDIVQPVYVGGFLADVLAGFTYQERERSFGLVRYSYAFPAGVSQELRELAPEIIFGSANVRPGGIQLTEVFDRSDFYTADYENIVPYLGADVEISPKLRFRFGMRYEDSTQIVDTRERTGDQRAIRVTQDGEFWLPAATLTYEIVDNMQLRFAYSQTINRPDPRELSTARFVDDERNLTFQGYDYDLDDPNEQGLRIAEITNYDVRFEWYFAAGESLTIGAFYKDFKNPIEQTASALGEDRLFSVINADSAEIKGIEVEVEKILFFQDWFGWDWLGSREMYIRANGSYIDSETVSSTENAGFVTNAVRPFQGQSEWLGNFQLGWRDYDRGENFSIILNYTGERQSFVGIFGADDEYERPPIMLNLAYSKEFEVGENILELTLRAQNLLEDEVEFVQEGIITEGYELGRTFSVGLTYKF